MNTKTFSEYCGKIAKGMVEQINKANFRSWREAAAKSQNGRAIRKVLEKEMHGEYNKVITEQILRNAELIKTIPRDVAYRVNKTIMERTLDGVRSDEIVEEIKRLVPHVSDVNAKRIARTEIGKTNAVLTQAKAQSIGLNYYLWRSCEDSRTRRSHLKMEGVLCDYNHPPAPELITGEKFVGRYNPSEIWNCRCYAEILTDIDDITFPAKMYYNDRIVTISKKKFKEISNM